MKRVLLLFTFVALVLAGVASADREAGACCPAGEAGQARMQGHGEAHHQAGTCGGPKAGAHVEGRQGCCETRQDGDGKAGCCAKMGAHGGRS
jgi:hypothetical protein